jgi:hypothetical protein
MNGGSVVGGEANAAGLFIRLWQQVRQFVALKACGTPAGPLRFHLNIGGALRLARRLSAEKSSPEDGDKADVSALDNWV